MLGPDDFRIEELDYMIFLFHDSHFLLCMLLIQCQNVSYRIKIKL